MISISSLDLNWISSLENKTGNRFSSFIIPEFYFTNPLAENSLLKLWWNGPPGLNFINILRKAFTLVDHKSVRIQSSCQYLYTHFGSTGAKAVRKNVDEIEPWFLQISLALGVTEVCETMCGRALAMHCGLFLANDW